MKVLKFGGTSVGSAHSLNHVKEIVDACQQQVIVVVSALGGVPVFYDVCVDTFNADAESLERAIEAV